MDSPIVVLGMAVGLWAAVIVYAYFSRQARARRTLARQPRTAMRYVREGEPCKVVGRLEYSESPMLAPFTARKCAAYSVDVYYNDPRRATSLLREDRCGDFFVRDQDGVCALVRGASARVVIITKDAKFRPPGLPILPKTGEPLAGLEEFLRARGISIEALVPTKSLCFEEGVLEAGELVSVVGVARWEGSSDLGAAGAAYRETPKLLVFSGSAEVPLLVSDDPDTTA